MAGAHLDAARNDRRNGRHQELLPYHQTIIAVAVVRRLCEMLGVLLVMHHVAGARRLAMVDRARKQVVGVHRDRGSTKARRKEAPTARHSMCTHAVVYPYALCVIHDGSREFSVSAMCAREPTSQHTHTHTGDDITTRKSASAPRDRRTLGQAV